MVARGMLLISLLVISSIFMSTEGMKGPREKELKDIALREVEHQSLKSLTNPPLKSAEEMRFRAGVSQDDAAYLNPSLYGTSSRGVLDVGQPYYGSYSGAHTPLPGVFGGGFGNFYRKPTPDNLGLLTPRLSYQAFGLQSTTIPYAGPYMNLAALGLRTGSDSGKYYNYGPNPYSLDAPIPVMSNLATFGPKPFGPHGELERGLPLMSSLSPLGFGPNMASANSGSGSNNKGPMFLSPYTGAGLQYYGAQGMGAPFVVGGYGGLGAGVGANYPSGVIPRGGGIPISSFGFQAGLPMALGRSMYGGVFPAQAGVANGFGRRFQVPLYGRALSALGYPNPDMDHFASVLPKDPPPPPLVAGGEGAGV